MCSFTVLGGSENQSVSGVTTICLTQCNTSPSHRADQAVDCVLWNVGPLSHFNGCVKLLDISRNWNTLSYTPIQSIPNMLNGWHVRWVCLPCKNWDIFSFQELCTDPCNMGPCIIILWHEVMAVDEWHNIGPQDLVTVSLSIQNAINKMHLCSLSITYACPYHNPTATMGHSIHNIDISKPLTHTTLYMLSAICPVFLQYLFSFQRGVRNRKGKPNAEAVWVVCVLSGELSVIHRGINRKGNVWAAALSFSPPVLPILSLSELPVSISTDVFLQFYPHKFSLSPFFPTISLYTVSASSCLWEACEGCVRVHVCVLCAFGTSRMSVLRTTAGG